MTKKVMLVWGLLLALLIVAPRPVDAQARIGLNWGATFATLEGDDAEGPFGEAPDLGNETGFFAGASLGLPLGGILSITPGLYFVQKGTSFERGSGFFEGFVELSYIEVPVTIGVAVAGADSPFGVRLFAGPEVAFEIDCDLDDSARLVTPAFSTSSSRTAKRRARKATASRPTSGSSSARASRSATSS